jgi:hypothetical protein
MTPHPHVRSASTRSVPAGEVTRAILCAPEAQCERWIAELAHTPIILQVARSVSNAVAALVEDPPPRPQVLVADVDAMTPGEILHLHAIRDHGWLGTLIVVGAVSPSLQLSLGVAQVVRGADSLRAAIGNGIDHGMQTVRIPRITATR